ncbi:MAG TPA: DUF721 domain-containing protein [Spirochaetota bacterium]|nr:DUF721 domain-containing protein [Spirochaetota bacterium]HNT09721.1 DUF721 domain-containing protein [Spirochaetota bacterium]HNV45636.1 DUF721 domain-containing protein [Spirochaetota bacterium]HOS39202.1 DUF721 domain-containing protein [Spirochaetota bacterium]HPI21678.1 DUF721 domain-containing protein [Spirochaetota bacterium]
MTRSSRHRHNATVPVSDLMAVAIAGLGMDEAVALERLRIAWPRVVGAIIAAHSRPDRVFKRTLFIAVDHSTFANDVMMMRDSIVKSLDEEMGCSMVKSIKTEVKRIAWGDGAKR